jgi:hypothetical protein
VPTVKLADKKSDTDEPSTDAVPTTSPSKAASIDYINNEIPITPRSTPQVLLLQQLLQKQQQQIVILQKLQPVSDSVSVVPTASTITLNPTSGSAGVVLTVHMKVCTYSFSFSTISACSNVFCVEFTTMAPFLRCLFMYMRVHNAARIRHHLTAHCRRE